MFRIPDDMRVIERTPVMPLDRSLEKWFNDETKDWSVVIFPKKVPDSRDDIRILDEWMTSRLCKVARGHLRSSQDSDESPETNANIAQQQLKIMDLGFSELIRYFF